MGKTCIRGRSARVKDLVNMFKMLIFLFLSNPELLGSNFTLSTCSMCTRVVIF